MTTVEFISKFFKLGTICLVFISKSNKCKLYNIYSTILKPNET